MPQDYQQDITSIKEWLAKESYLPQDFDDHTLKKFLHSCYGSLEKTKKCIEKFCTKRSNMPEIYTLRDPLGLKLQTAFKYTTVATYNANGNEILIHRLNDIPLDKFEFYELLKAFTTQADYWIYHHDVFPESHIVILDIKYYTLKLVTKVNIFFFKEFLLYLLDSMPVRLKQVHVINCPSFYEMLYGLVKGALPSEICNIINFHDSFEGLHKFIDKKHLPIEYGGEAPSMNDEHQKWVDEICTEKNRKVCLNDDFWKADLKKKPKNGVADAFNGSFRTLSID